MSGHTIVPNDLSCPFCGGTELTEHDSYVACWNCEARGPTTASNGGGLGSLDLWSRRVLGRAELTPDTIPAPAADEPHYADPDTGCTCDYAFETHLWKHARDCAIYSAVGCSHVFHGTKTCVYCGKSPPDFK